MWVFAPPGTKQPTCLIVLLETYSPIPRAKGITLCSLFFSLLRPYLWSPNANLKKSCTASGRCTSSGFDESLGERVVWGSQWESLSMCPSSPHPCGTGKFWNEGTQHDNPAGFNVCCAEEQHSSCFKVLQALLLMDFEMIIPMNCSNNALLGWRARYPGYDITDKHTFSSTYFLTSTARYQEEKHNSQKKQNNFFSNKCQAKSLMTAKMNSTIQGISKQDDRDVMAHDLEKRNDPRIKC